MAELNATPGEVVAAEDAGEDATATAEGEDAGAADTVAAVEVAIEEVAVVEDFESTMAALLEDVGRMQVEASRFQVKIDRQIEAGVAKEETSEAQPPLETGTLQSLPDPAAVAESRPQSPAGPPPAYAVAATALKPHPGSWYHAVSMDWRSLGIAPSEVWSDAELVLNAVGQDARAMQYASQELRSHRDFVLKAVEIQGASLQYVSSDLSGDRELVEAAIRQDRLSLRFASPELRADPKLIELAMRASEPWVRCGQAVQSEAVELNSDKAAVHEAVYAIDPDRWHSKIRRDWRRLEVAPMDVKSNRDLVLEIVQDSWGRALQHAAEPLRADRLIVLEAVQADGLMLQYASPELRNDIEVVRAAAYQNWQALAFASEKPCADRTLIQAAMTQHWEALQYASAALCQDQQFMLQAVVHHGHSLKYASDILKADRALVLKAVRQNWESLKYASINLQEDAELCLVASKPSSCYGFATWYAEDEQQLRRKQIPGRDENISATLVM